MISRSAFERQSISEWSCRDVNSNYSGFVKVGSGTYGEVHKAQVKDDPTKTVALKKIRDETETQGFPITALREISILQSLNHQNIVKLLEVVTAKPIDTKSKKGSTYLVFEYMEHELLGLIESIKFSPSQVKCIMKQLLEGLDYLHSSNIIHRDIKSANILMNNKGEVKIADFGLAKKIQSGANLTPRVVTRWYRAPELLLGSRKYTGKVDIWALGCVFAELLIGRPSALFPAQKTPDQFEMICDKCGTPNDESWPDHRSLPLFAEMKIKGDHQRNIIQYMRKMIPNVDEIALEMLDSMLVLNPEKRINAKEALQHAYFFSDPLPCRPLEMPKVEKDCHSFTIKAEREKYREMLNLARHSSEGVQHPNLAINNISEQNASKNPRGIGQKRMSSKTNTKNLDCKLEAKNSLQNVLIRTKSQGPQMIEPLQENLSLVKSRSNYKEPLSQVLHTIKSDSTLDTDGAPGSRNDERSMSFHFVLPPLVINSDRSRYGSQSILESAKKKINQQSLAELERISKKICAEGMRNEAEPKSLIRETLASDNKF